MITRRFMPLLATAGLIAATAIATATVVQHVGVDDLARECHRAVDGTARTSRVVLDEATGRIWTEWQVDVGETLVGEAAERVTVSIPGGKYGELEQEIHGTAELREGERAVLFLWEEDGRAQVLGQAQGCLRVAHDDASGALVCRNSISGLTLMGADGKATSAEPLRLPLTDLRKRVAAVRAEVEAERKRREDALEQRLEELRRRAIERAELLGDRPGAGN